MIIGQVDKRDWRDESEMKKFMHHVAKIIDWDNFIFTHNSESMGVRCTLCDKKIMGNGYHFTHKVTQEGMVLGPGCYKKAKGYYF